MTAQTILDRTDALRPNAFSHAQKLAWLNELDRQAHEEVILTHEGGGAFTLRGPEDELLIPPPYDRVYHHYLCMQMDLAGREIAMYNNDRSLFNAAYLSWQDAYNRHHMPLQGAERFRV